MKPRNKFQHAVVKASKSLPPLTEAQIKWGYQNCFDHIGRRTREGVITCTECGHSWKGEGELINTLLGCECPHCHAKLTVQTTRKRTFKQTEYFGIVTTCKGVQVVRVLLAKCTAKVGELPRYTCHEVMQRWLAPNGKYATIARLRQTMGTLYLDSWCFTSCLELRVESWIYKQIEPNVIYNRQRVIPALKKRGYKSINGLPPFKLLCALLTNNKLETIIKSEQLDLLRFFLDNGCNKIDDYWQSICICNRNGYKVKDASLWCDYIDFLRFFGKDLHNAKYVCPADLKAEHDRYMYKKAKAEVQRQKETDDSFKEKEARYKDSKGAFFGLNFTDGMIEIHVLESVEEMILEGKAMHHCVGGYYDKEDSLILSASIDEQKIETVEVSLSQLQVIQCRGTCNKNTRFHDQIVELVRRNMKLIQQRISA